MEGVGEFSAHCVNKSEFVLLLHENLKSCWVCANAQLKEKKVGGYWKTDSCPVLIIGLVGNTPYYSGRLICAIIQYSFQLLITLPEH